MWFPKFIACMIIYVVTVYLLGIAVGVARRDFVMGCMIAIGGGSGVGLVGLAIGFAVWIFMGAAGM